MPYTFLPTDEAPQGDGRPSRRRNERQGDKAISPRAAERLMESLQLIAAASKRGDNWMVIVRSAGGIITVHEVMPPYATGIRNKGQQPL